MEEIIITNKYLRQLESDILNKKDIRNIIITSSNNIIESLLIFFPKDLANIINEYYEKKYMLEYQTYHMNNNTINIYFLSLEHSDKKYTISLHILMHIYHNDYSCSIYKNHISASCNDFNKYLVNKPDIEVLSYGTGGIHKSIYFKMNDFTYIYNVTADLVKILNILLTIICKNEKFIK